MVKWKEETVIEANIEKVWSLFSDKNIKRIFPKVEDHILLENEDDTAGAKHSQSYYQGDQLETYLIETIAYEDGHERKYRETSFTLGNMFAVNYQYTLEKLAENKTRFIYGGSQKGVNLTAKAMLMAGSKSKRTQTVRAFMERVEAEAMKTATEEGGGA